MIINYPDSYESNNNSHFGRNISFFEFMILENYENGKSLDGNIIRWKMERK